MVLISFKACGQRFSDGLDQYPRYCEIILEGLIGGWTSVILITIFAFIDVIPIMRVDFKNKERIKKF